MFVDNNYSKELYSPNFIHENAAAGMNPWLASKRKEEFLFASEIEPSAKRSKMTPPSIHFEMSKAPLHAHKFRGNSEEPEIKKIQQVVGGWARESYELKQQAEKKEELVELVQQLDQLSNIAYEIADYGTEEEEEYSLDEADVYVTYHSKDTSLECVAITSLSTFVPNSVNIDFIVKSPQNIRNVKQIMPESTRLYHEPIAGLGSFIIKEIISDSIKNGKNGSITLTSVASSVVFYERLGFVQLPMDLNPMFLSSAKALELIRERQ